MTMLPSPVAYLVHRDGADPAVPDGKAYAYVLAGNGVFKIAANRHISARIPLATAHVAGLPRLRPHVETLFGRIPGRVLRSVLADARRQSWGGPREAMYHLVIQEGQVRVLRPPQQANAAHLAYTGGDGVNVICDLHSHHEMRPFFSGKDDRDEQGFRFYAVIGRIFTRPEITLRIGVYGDTYRVPATKLFTDLGPFREAER
jgi:PRTRC genetic system protein A